MARILPSVVCLTNFRSFQSNRPRTVFEWENLSINLDEYVDQRPNRMLPSTHPILSIVQLTPLAHSKIKQQTRRAPTTTHTTSVQTLKMTILSVTSVFKLTKLESAKPNKLTIWCSGKPMPRSPRNA